ncbi:MAG: cobalamin-binding protein [Spirulinaceae cyanobacterium SM2_1_0]|nr:cobalamin-binding protein [Spirulinaceae cyanobacterium SM2_1_0]
MTNPRIVSLLPSATEIVAVLGLLPQLVGRSHECDFPSAVTALPICTEPRFTPEGNSREIHARVTTVLESALSVYRVKIEVLAELQPTHILTQAQCEVCAVSQRDVEAAVAELTGCQPQILSLQPMVLAEVWQDVQRVAELFDLEATPVVESLVKRAQTCQSQSARGARPTVACIEWIEPLMVAGNWLPELVALAGGESLLGSVGQHSSWLQWEELVQADPDVVVFMPCGFDLAKTRTEAEAALGAPHWLQLRAVQTGRVYVTDGNAYFNRPGPRLVESAEILAEILHPQLVGGQHQGTGWQQLTPRPSSSPVTVQS